MIASGNAQGSDGGRRGGRRARGAGVLVVGGALAALACGCTGGEPAMPGGPAQAPAPPQLFVGTVADDDAWVGVVATEHHARIFVCGGPATYATMTHWFTVDLDDAGLVDFDAGATGDDFSLTGGLALGVITVSGVAHPYQTAPVVDQTIAGLYEANGPCGHLGLIVSQSAADVQPTAQGACVPAAGAAATGANPVLQVNPLSPVARAADGSIAVTVAGASDPLLLFAATPPAP